MYKITQANYHGIVKETLCVCNWINTNWNIMLVCSRGSSARRNISFVRKKFLSIRIRTKYDSFIVDNSDILIIQMV